MNRIIERAALSALVTVAAGAIPDAHADDVQILSRIDAMQAQIEAQQKSLAAQQAEIERLRAALRGGGKAAVTPEQAAAPEMQAQVDALKAQVEEQANAARLQKQEQPVWTIANGRPGVQSADGRFSLSLRGRLQLDMARHFQDDPGVLNVDFRRGSVGSTSNREVLSARELSDGANFRRAQIGFEGRVWRDFGYRFVYEFGGSGSEGPARINDAWVSYTGLAPFTFQVGAFSTMSNLDDATGSEETLFIERASAAELSRSLAGADGRYSAGARANGERWFASLFWSGGTAGDAETAGEQGAIVGRAATLVAGGEDFSVHAGANGAFVHEPADQGSLASGARYPVRFRERPELRVDSTRLIDTGLIDADTAYSAGLEAAAGWRSLFFQGEYFRYGIERRAASALDDPSFGGWYAQASWILTGEARRYNMATASFNGPKPMVPVSADGGWGAVELAARFSHVDLDFHEGAPGTAAAADSVRGGTQDIWTLGLNWYLNANLRATLNWFLVDVDRLNPASAGNPTPFGASPSTPPDGAQLGQDYQAIALRTQFTF